MDSQVTGTKRSRQNKWNGQQRNKERPSNISGHVTNKLSVIISAFESLLNMVNQTVSVCTKTMAGEFGDEEPNLEKWF